jgi:predicted transcriptional regulator
VEFAHFYSTKTWKAKLFHWIAGRRIAKESQATLDAIKSAIESSAA